MMYQLGLFYKGFWKPYRPFVPASIFEYQAVG